MSHLHDFSYDANPNTEVLNVKPAPARDLPSRVSIRETQTDEDILNLARDKCLQDFHLHKLRERRSFLVGSLQKLRSRQSQLQQPKFVQDSTIPPYNYADDLHAYVSDTSPVEPAPVVCTGKDRTFSASIKGRLKKFLGRASQPAKGLPPQQVRAKQLHQSVIRDDLALSGSRQVSLKFSEAVAAMPSNVNRTSEPRHFSQARTEASRVTSWTNSTTEGTQSALSDRSGTESAALQRSESVHTLRQRASFFGRSVQNKLRKPSRPDLQGSAQSQGLFSALQGLMQHKEQPSTPQTSNTCEVLEQSVVQSQPPQQASSFAKSGLIRTVPPEVRGDNRAMSPVVEVASPYQMVAQAKRCQDPSADEPDVVRPSSEQIANRMERARSRWQGALASTNPYQLSSLPSMQARASVPPVEQPQQVDALGLLRSQALSPSVYSQATASRTATPEGHMTTMVTITNREVKRYKISPSKDSKKAVEEQPVQVSSEWRRWLSGEIKGISAAGLVKEADADADADAIPPITALTDSAVSESPASTDCVTLQSHQTRNSGTPSADASTGAKRRPRARLSSRQSSYMNERYPMVDSSRNSSNPSIHSRRGHTPVHRNDPEEHSTTVDGEGPRCMDGLKHGLRSKSDLGQYGIEATSDQPAMDNAATRLNTRSTIELRAQYRSRLSDNSKQINIRKKSKYNPVDFVTDETLQNISAGPYATDMRKTATQQENSTPCVNHDRLPALSSSEWLAGPVSKQRSAGPSSRGAGIAHMTGKGGSPGRRLATGWLEGRSQRSRENTPAFV
ncbi:hypothetical protein AMS68_000277 [Peltaster fructicola]|uniref:Uncharacterized protein n=1 Tax=Peltaster fructicola TaxID=286661 RepID=A0A6H0XJR3_9PEZI|nr:hypothetical protein AMS68_000277 [Peltaster fructicola]